MNLGRTIRRWVALTGMLGMVTCSSLSVVAADSLQWSSDKDSVDADIASWSLMRTLEAIAEATGWQVYLEPGTKRTVSTRFKARSKDRALDLLLDDLGRALLPGTNGGPARLLVFRNSQADATKLIRGKSKRGKPIPDELIVRMKSGKSIDELAAELGAKVLGKSEGLNAGRLKFDSEEAAQKAREKLLDNPNVESSDPNYRVLDQPAPDHSSSAAGANLNLKPLKAGDPLVVGLIDTGVQKTGGAFDTFLLPGISAAGESAPASEGPTHGTSMLEVLLKSVDSFSADGADSSVKILPVDVFGKNGATTFEVAEGIAQALKNGARVVNLSLGSDGDTPFLHDVIRQGAEAGALFVASAGNQPTSDTTFPAGYPEVISVTAGNSPTSLAPYANFSPYNDVMAPGTAYIQYDGVYYAITGTSTSAANVSGALAAALAAGQTADQARQSIRRTFPAPPTVRTSVP